MSAPTIQQLVAALHKAWNAETSFTPHEWSRHNTARGQCLVSSLVVQDYYGGDIRRYNVTGKGIKETHYCNMLVDGTIIDTTASQYKKPVVIKVTDVALNGYPTARSKYLADMDTDVRYKIFKKRVKSALA